MKNVVKGSILVLMVNVKSNYYSNLFLLQFVSVHSLSTMAQQQPPNTIEFNRNGDKPIGELSNDDILRYRDENIRFKAYNDGYNDGLMRGRREGRIESEEGKQREFQEAMKQNYLAGIQFGRRQVTMTELASALMDVRRMETERIGLKESLYALRRKYNEIEVIEVEDL